jgi:hypothetical protein
MTSYIRKYVTALASAKDYVSQWSSDHVYADDALIVPFPTLAIFNPDKDNWSVHIKAWLYLPFEGKKIKSYIPSLRSFLPGKTTETQESSNEIDTEKKLTATVAIQENDRIKKQEESVEKKTDEDDDDDDMYEDALRM